MSNKQPRHSSPSRSTPHVSAKLSKFLQKPSRDRSKSMNEPVASPSTSSVASSTSSTPEFPSTPSSKSRKGSKFLGRKDKDKDSIRSPERAANDQNNLTSNTTSPSSLTDMDDSPVLVEPVAIPRPRNRSDRPITSAPDPLQVSQIRSSNSSSSSRVGDLPSRLTGWLTNTFNTSTTDLSLPSILAQSSPKSKASAILAAAKHSKGHFDKAMRYLLDSDATPDKCTDPIWLLGVQHPGYEPPSPDSSQAQLSASTGPGGRRLSGSPASFRSSTSSVASNSDVALALSQSTSSKNNPAAHWPPVFYIDFVSRIWLTYRSHFSQPIKDTTLEDLCNNSLNPMASPTTAKGRWHWGGEKTWTSDTGWGCMLRTGQSLLANTLIHAHLGREWRRPPYPVHTADYATYVQILTLFLDTPSLEAPFSVHRMALAGKELGTDVGQWFGPSVAAGAIKRLVNVYPGSGIGVSVAKDGVLIQTDVYLASHGELGSQSPRKSMKTTWGDRPVLVLIGLRLGIDGVNPIYYGTIKMLFTFPQSVGIAGGRPSSSYYFVGSQADCLFYLDPHHARPAIPLRPPPSSTPVPPIRRTTPDPDSQDRDRDQVKNRKQRSPSTSYHTYSHGQYGHNTSHGRIPTSPSSIRTSSSTFSPSPLQQQLSTDSEDSALSGTSEASKNSNYRRHGRWTTTSSITAGVVAPSSSPSTTGSDMDIREFGNIGNSNGGNSGLGGPIPVAVILSQSSSGSGSDRGIGGLDEIQQHYVTAYSPAELKTFHCERVRKLPLSGLDPSMLLGFLCKDEEEWLDFKKRVEGLPKSIFSIQNEPPNWSTEDFNNSLESMSEPDEFEMDSEEEDVDSEKKKSEVGNESDDEDDEDEGVGSIHVHSRTQGEEGTRASTSEGDTEEDPVDPLTPGPQSRFDLSAKGKEREESVHSVAEEVENDIEDDWIDSGDPAMLTPIQPPAVTSQTTVPPSLSPSPSPPPEPSPATASAISERPVIVTKSKNKSSSRSHGKSKSEGEEKDGSHRKKGKGKKQTPVPVPMVRLPSSSESQQQESFPFPGSGEDDVEDSNTGYGPGTRSWERGRHESQSWAGVGGPIIRMHTAKGRDGGRTQSGGVKGILTED